PITLRPDIDVSATSLEFSSTVGSESAANGVSVTNVATTAVTISAPFFFGNPQFKATGCNQVLQPREGCRFTIVYAPKTLGVSRAVMTFYASLPSTTVETHTVDLNGTATMPVRVQTPSTPRGSDPPPPAERPKLTVPPNLLSMSFDTDGRSATLVANGGDIYSTKDGGLTWSGQAAAGNKSFVAVDKIPTSTHISPNGKDGWQAGSSTRIPQQAGILLRTSDGGKQWIA